MPNAFFLEFLRSQALTWEKWKLHLFVWFKESRKTLWPVPG